MSLLNGYIDKVIDTDSTAFVLGSLSVLARTDRGAYRALMMALESALDDLEAQQRYVCSRCLDDPPEGHVCPRCGRESQPGNYTGGTIPHNRPTNSGP